MPHGYGRGAELEESGDAAVAATAIERGESKVATSWLPT
jgi:hypothetical protein